MNKQVCAGKRISWFRRKRKLSFKKRVQGSVSIFLLVIMFPMLVFSFTVVDLCKIFMAKDMVVDAADVAVNSGLTSYDKVLKDVYGILATSATEEELSEKMSEYYIMTLEMSGGKLDADDEEYIQNLVSGLFSTSVDLDALSSNNNLLQLTSEKNGDYAVSAIAVEESAVSNPTVLKRQIVEYMKYRAPVSLATGMLEKIGAFKDLNNQTAATEAKLEYDEALSDISASSQSIYTMLRIFISNAKALETGKNTFEKIYTGTDYQKTEQTAVDKYLFFNSVVKLSTEERGISYDLDFNIRSMGECINEISAAVFMLQYVAPFRNAKIAEVAASDSDLDSVLDYLEKVAQQEDDGYAFPDEFGAILDCSKQQKINEVFDLENFKQAMTNFSYPLSGDIEPEIKDGLTLLANAAGAYNENYRGDNSDLWEYYVKFVSYYKRLEKEYKKIEEKDYDDLNETEKKVWDLYNGVISNTSSYSKLEAIYEALTDGLGNIQKFATEKLDKAVKEKYELYMEQYCTVVCEMYRQKEVLAALVSDKDSAIDTLWDNLQSAKTKGEEWGEAVEKVQTTEVHTSMSVQQKGETSMLIELTEEEKNALVNVLKEEKQLYDAVYDYLIGYKFFDKAMVNKPSASSWTAAALYSYDSLAAVLVEKVKEGSIHTPSSPNTVNTAGENLSEIIPENIATKPTNTKDSWDKNVQKIQENSMYGQIKKVAEPTRTTTSDPEVKNKVDELGKTGDDGLPATAKAQTQDTTSSDTDPGNAIAGLYTALMGYTDLSNVQTFEEYYAELTETDPQKSTSDSNAISTKGTGESNKDTSANAKDMLGDVGNFFAKLAEAARDDLYMTEYVVNMFSCYTTNMDDSGTGTLIKDSDKKETMMSGEKFCEKTNWYRHEVEYILYGLDTPSKNIAAASGSIFGVRFVLNLIYSFTDSEINTFTTSAATAVAGLFPFAIPLVKAAIHIGLSIAEAGYDLAVLLNGGEIPIIKSYDTWICKPSTLAKKFTEVVVTQVGNAAINVLTDAAVNAIEKIATEGEKAIDEYAESDDFNNLIDNTTDSLKSSINSMIRTPIADTLTQVIMVLPENFDKNELRQELENKLSALKNDLVGASGSDDGVLSLAFNTFLDKYWDTAVKSVIDKAVDNANKVIEEATGYSLNAATSDKETVVDAILKPLDDRIDDLLQSDKIKSKITETTKTALKNVATEVKKGTIAGSDKIKETFNTQMGNLSKDYSGTTMSDLNLSKSGSAKAPLRNILTMSYKDYMYVFLAIGFISNAETAMLERTAQVMSVNCGKLSGENGYSLNKAVTLIGVEARASVKTVFYGAVFDENGVFHPSASNKYTFTTRTYMGY